MSETATLMGTAGAALNLAGNLLTLLVNKGLLTHSEFESVVKASAADEETRDAIRIIWKGVV